MAYWYILVVGTVTVLTRVYWRMLVHTGSWHVYGVDTCLLAHAGLYW